VLRLSTYPVAPLAALQLSTTLALPAVAVSPVGAAGTVTGAAGVALTAAELALVPAESEAATTY
jgi:hypothetical protein